MENATRALLMAGGILLGVLILALMVTLFVNSSQVSKEYETHKQELSVQQFNANFTKYLNRDLSIHEVVTICNFANYNNVKQVTISGKCKDQSKIYGIVKDYDKNNIETYRLYIVEYSDEGYISEIRID